MTARAGSVRLAAVAAVVVALAGCSGVGPSPSASAVPGPTATATGSGATESGDIVIDIPDEILEAVVAQVVGETGVSADDVTILRAEPVTWRDGSLGCPQRGVMYIQVLIEGFWVVLQAGEDTYDFRVDNQGNFRLCPAGQGQLPSRP